MRYISLKNEQNRCNALRGALLLPVSFSRAVFCTGRTHTMSVCAAKLSNTSYGVVGEHQRVLNRIIYGSRGSLARAYIMR